MLGFGGTNGLDPQHLSSPSNVHYRGSTLVVQSYMRLTRIPPWVERVRAALTRGKCLQSGTLEDVGFTRLDRFEAERTHRLDEDCDARDDRRRALGM
jgi:hypothetical protein